MKNFRKIAKKKRGFTLIELSVVMILVVMISTTLGTMLSQQLQFFRWWHTQKFIAEDAPLINSLFVRIYSNADAFRIHSTKAGALAGTGGATADGAAMLLGFSQPDGTTAYGVVEYDSAAQKLLYNNVTVDAATGDRSQGSQWTIASGVADASFDIVDSTMQLTMTGPYGGQITYAATPSL